MARVITGDQADTPITDIPIGIAGSGGTATGAIGRSCVRIAAPPQPERRSSTVIL